MRQQSWMIGSYPSEIVLYRSVGRTDGWPPILAQSWLPLGPSWLPLEPLAPSCLIFALSCAILASLLCHLGSILGHPGSLLGPSWLIRTPSWPTRTSQRPQSQTGQKCENSSRMVMAGLGEKDEVKMAPFFYSLKTCFQDLVQSKLQKVSKMFDFSITAKVPFGTFFVKELDGLSRIMGGSPAPTHQR